MEELPEDSIVILDTSVLLAMGGPSNEKYRAFERYVTRRGIVVRVPEQVAVEFGERPGAYAYQRDRLRAAEEAGWLERAIVDFSIPAVSDAADRTRTRMASLAADDVSADEIEKTDTVLAGLAYQYVAGASRPVTVLVSDRVAERAIEDVLSATGVGDRATVVEGRTFLESLGDKGSV